LQRNSIYQYAASSKIVILLSGIPVFH